MCNVLDENVDDFVKAHSTSELVGLKLRQNFLPLQSIYQGICQILHPGQQSSSGPELGTSKTDNLSSGAGHGSSTREGDL